MGSGAGIWDFGLLNAIRTECKDFVYRPEIEQILGKPSKSFFY